MLYCFIIFKQILQKGYWLLVAIPIAFAYNAPSPYGYHPTSCNATWLILFNNLS